MRVMLVIVGSTAFCLGVMAGARVPLDIAAVVGGVGVGIVAAFVCIVPMLLLFRWLGLTPQPPNVVDNDVINDRQVTVIEIGRVPVEPFLIDADAIWREGTVNCVPEPAEPALASNTYGMRWE